MSERVSPDDAASELPAPVRQFRRLTDFAPLLPGEKKLLKAAQLGEVCELGDERPQAQSEDNEIRAPFIRWLALGGDEDYLTHAKGVQLQGAFISGEFDLQACREVLSLVLVCCRFEKVLNLRDALLAGLNLGGSYILGLKGDGLKTTGNVFLRNDFHAEGEVNLSGAGIDGQLACVNGRFENPGGKALSGDGLKANSGVFLRDGFHAIGEVRFLKAEIGGQLDCSDGRFENPNGHALVGDGLKSTGDVFMSENFYAIGEVRLPNAEIGGQMNCDNGRFENPSGDALVGDGLKTIGDVFFREKFYSTGKVSLNGAEIGGTLDCSKGRFENPVEDRGGQQGCRSCAQSSGNPYSWCFYLACLHFGGFAGPVWYAGRCIG